MEKLRRLSQLKDRQQDDALRILMDDDTIHITLKYCEETLSRPERISENLSEYSPMRISQLVF